MVSTPVSSSRRQTFFHDLRRRKMSRVLSGSRSSVSGGAAGARFAMISWSSGETWLCRQPINQHVTTKATEAFVEQYLRRQKRVYTIDVQNQSTCIIVSF